MTLTPDPRSWTLHLPYLTPPLNLNSRLHHMKRYRLEQGVIADTRWLVRGARIPALGRCSVQLHYRPTRNIRRDTDNLVATLKPICDALTQEGVVADDTPAFMAKPEPILHPAQLHQSFPPRRLWVVVTELEPWS